MTYRSNMTPGSALWAGRRAHWRGMGLTEEEMLMPKIAVINSSSKLALCFSHLDDVAATVAAEIRAAGGIPFEVRTTAPSDFVTSAGKGGAYILPARELIAADVESQVEGALLDGMIFLSSCDKTAPAHLMSAVRSNVPSILVICGYQAAGHYKGQHTDIEDVFLKSSNVAEGGLSVAELSAMADVAIRSPGVCAGMGTANSMHVVSEALGMTMPGSAPVRAMSDKMNDKARAAARRIVEMVEQDLRPRQIITEAAIRNAVQVIISLSGSINCVKHLQAIAVEAELPVDVMALFEEYSRNTPLVCAVRPSGETLTETFEDAGGAQGVMQQLRARLDTSVLTVTGQSLGAVLDAAPPVDAQVIRPLEDPISTRPTLIIVRGSMLPGGGIVRIGGGDASRRQTITGPARVFHSRAEALDAIRDGQVQKGDVVVLRGIGVKGGPGLAMTSAVVFALQGAGLVDDVGVITEGQLSGLVNMGLVVGEASPEAAAGGPIGLIVNGDSVTIDVPSARVDLNVAADVLAARAANPQRFGLDIPNGWLNIYQKLVGPVHEGAVMSPGGPALAGEQR